MQMKVIKRDRTVEPYMHTKVIGTLNHAMTCIDQPNLFAAESIAEAITFYLYHERPNSAVTSEEIHLLILAALTGTGYENAAEALRNTHLGRNLRRNRIEIVYGSPGYPFGGECWETTAQWNKSKIVDDLMSEYGLEAAVARAVASGVEEKILKLGMPKISSELVRQIVLADLRSMKLVAECLEVVEV